MRFRLLSILSVVFALIGLGTASAETASPARLQPVGEHAIIAADGRVSLAAQPRLEDLDAWAASGVKTIVNMRSIDETRSLAFDLAAEAAARDLAYVEVPLGGAHPASPATTARLSEVLAQTEGQIVLHCRSGTRVAHAYAAHLINEGELSRATPSALGWPGPLAKSLIDKLLAPEIEPARP